MSPILVLSLIVIYFIILILISRITGKDADNNSFFLGNRKAPWYLVAFGMIGASLSGVTFISVPGWVGTNQFSYMQMVFGYLVGYFVIARVLMPLYYKMNLTSIYSYLEDRFGFWSYKSGAFYFLLSRIIGASFRLYLVAGVLQIAVFDSWGMPFEITVILTVVLIWLYTSKAGIKTIIRTDVLQTFFMLTALFVSIWFIADDLGYNFNDLCQNISHSDYSRIFFFDDWNDKKHFVKQFLSGVFIAIVMTGLDQDMMQKNLSCKNIGDAQKNMFWFSIVLVVVNFMFLCLGALLYLYSNAKGLSIPDRTDDLYPFIATQGHAGMVVAICFILGLIAAAYSSADSALTSLTTSLSVDFLNVNKLNEKDGQAIRRKAHLFLSGILIIVILVFKAFNNDSVISAIFTLAGYTYGPLLGMYAFGIITSKSVNDKLVPFICIASPLLCYFLNLYSELVFNGFKFGFELLIVNGGFTFIGLWLISRRRENGIEGH